VPTPTPTCPKCLAALQAVELKGASVLACATCHGTRVDRSRLSGLLEAMSAELLETFDPDTALEKASVPSRRLTCAACGREMERDDYCGAGLAFFDRCEPCGLLWIDAEALGTMTLMWARMEARHSRDEAATRKFLEGADALVARTLLARTVSRSLLRLMG
jgi:Zn-finger nucleic acid-binding protein